MNDKIIYNSYAKHFNAYRKLLIEDIEAKPMFAALANLIYNRKFNSVAAYIKSLEIENFMFFKSIIPIRTDIDLTDKHDIKSMNYDFKYVQYNEHDLYDFFCKKESYIQDELYKDHYEPYYITDKNLYINIDNLVKKTLADYKYLKKNRITKTISKDFKILIDLKNWENNINDIRNYRYPRISIEFKNFIHKTNLFDAGHFLFFHDGSFFQFFHIIQFGTIVEANSKDLRFAKNQKTDEPYLYIDENNKYTLTNSEAGLKVFNKFIYLNTELYVHYFKVYEQWLIDYVLPELESLNV